MQSNLFRIAIVAGTLGLSGLGAAHDYTLKDLRIDHPYARATPPGARAGGAFFAVENRGTQADRLIGVASPAAAATELHTMSMEGNVMRMRAVTAIDVPPGATVTLKPGGLHVMLLELKQPLAAGGKVPLTLTFERAGQVDVVVDVEAMVPASGAPHPH